MLKKKKKSIDDLRDCFIDKFNINSLIIKNYFFKNCLISIV